MHIWVMDWSVIQHQILDDILTDDTHYIRDLFIQSVICKQNIYCYWDPSYLEAVIADTRKVENILHFDIK